MKRTHWFALALGLLAFLLLGGPTQLASAGPAPAPVRAPILDSFIDVWIDTVYNLWPAVAYNSRHDEYLVAWYNDRGVTRDIYAQRVSGDGTLKSWFAVATGAGEVNRLPDIAYSPVQDEYLIVYTHADATPSATFDVWARRVKWDGSDLGLPAYAPFPIRVDSDEQWNARVAYNNQNDEYLVVYQNDWLGGLKDIAAQRVRASDGALQSWRNIASGANQWHIDPHVAYNAARNEYLIAYSFYVNPYTEADVRGKVTSFNMDTLSSEIAICNEPDNQNDIAVAAGPDEYLVVWAAEEVGTTDGYDIMGRRVSGAGAPLGSGGFTIAGAGDTKLYNEPAVAYSPGYGYLVAWAHDVDPGGAFAYDVGGRYVMPGQNQAAGNWFALDNSAYGQTKPDLACDLMGDCLVVEEDEWSPAGAGDYEIRGRFVRPHHVYLPLALRGK